jgi:hypothetical protein
MNKLVFFLFLSSLLDSCLLFQDLSLKLKCTGLSIIECAKENCSFDEYFPATIIIGQEEVNGTFASKTFQGTITDSEKGIKIAFTHNHLWTLNFTFEKWSHLAVNGITDGEFHEFLLNSKTMKGKVLARYNISCQTF